MRTSGVTLLMPWAAGVCLFGMALMAGCDSPSTVAAQPSPQTTTAAIAPSGRATDTEGAKSAAVEFIKTAQPSATVLGTWIERYRRSIYVVTVDFTLNEPKPSKGAKEGKANRTQNLFVRVFQGENQKAYWKAEPLTPDNLALLMLESSRPAEPLIDLNSLIGPDAPVKQTPAGPQK
jgi:hypothetical protein